MPYNVQMVGKAEREEKIRKGIGASTSKEIFHDFRNSSVQLDLIKLPIGVPVYRMENFRTFTYQREFLANEEKPEDFFANGQEVESAQQAQHDLLAALARKGKSDSVTPVIEVLAKEKQRQPILITNSGVVVNGNRRLAAMRELSENDAAFSHVDCQVLPPDANADDILNIEAALQAKPETKLAYDWIGDAQLITRMMLLHQNIGEVSRRLNRGEKEIRNSMAALTEADIYLTEWRETPGDYSAVKDDAEQLFKDMPKHLEGKDTGLKKASRAIAYTLFEHKEKLPGRVYGFNAAFGKLASEVLDKIASDLGISTETTTEDDSEEDNSFSIDLGEEETAHSYEAVVETLKESKEEEDVIDALIEAAQNAVEMEKGQKSGQAALKAVQQAHAKLMSVDIQRAAPDTRGAIKKQLESIANHTAALVSRLNAFGEDEAGTQ